MVRLNLLFIKISILIIYSFTHFTFAQNIRIITPYIGSITDKYKSEKRNLDLKDNSLLKGIFFQWVNPENYQWNAFVYQSSDINYSTLWGGHFIFDYYASYTPKGKFVFGIGTEYLQIDMDADSSITPLKNFELTNRIFIPYIRFGYSYRFDQEKFKLSVLPWLGIQYQRVRGDLTMAIDPPGPAPLTTSKENIKSDDYFMITGLNLHARIFHMLEIEAKYYGTFNSKNYYSTTSGMVNLYLSRNLGLSYRIKFMELNKGYDFYNLFGIAFVF